MGLHQTQNKPFHLLWDVCKLKCTQNHETKHITTNHGFFINKIGPTKLNSDICQFDQLIILNHLISTCPS